jgi:hypothetical protein
MKNAAHQVDDNGIMNEMQPIFMNKHQPLSKPMTKSILYIYITEKFQKYIYQK